MNIHIRISILKICVNMYEINMTYIQNMYRHDTSKPTVSVDGWLIVFRQYPGRL